MVISINTVINMSFTMLMCLISVGFFTLFERKLLGLVQSRVGPSKVCTMGILQPLVDAIKLLSKLFVDKSSSLGGRSALVILSPVVFFILSCSLWVAYPCNWMIFSCPTSIVLVLVVIGLSVYGVVTIGWISKSKYALVGAFRAIAQSVSYEVVVVLGVFSVVWVVSSCSFDVIWQLVGIGLILIFPFIFSFCICYLSLLAESGRTPFDLVEGESEIVAGWNVELGGQSFTLAFLSEQLSVVWGSVFIVGLFLGVNFMLLKALIIVYSVIVVRAAYTRMRFDKVMSICWLNLLPFMMVCTMFYIIFI